MARIGLIAGYGSLPIVFADAARKRGDEVVVFALKGVTPEEIAGHAEKVHWFEWGNLQKALFVLATERLKKIAMLGKIKKDLLFQGDEKLDSTLKGIVGRIGDRKDYSILNKVSKAMASFGVEVMDPTEYLGELIPVKGVITKRAPAENEISDINYGTEIAGKLAGFDIGQTIAVRDKTIIAIEAVEGTNEMIKRAGSLCKIGFSVVKVARPVQDMRFDIPVIGPDTITALARALGKALALEEKKTLLLEKDEVIRLANESGIAVVII